MCRHIGSMAASGSGGRPTGGGVPPIKGGRQQRKRKLAEHLDANVPHQPQSRVAVPAQFDSETALSLIGKWAWGFIPATEVQSTAQDTYRDMKTMLDGLGLSLEHIASSIRHLASLGSWGKMKAMLREISGTGLASHPSHLPGHLECFAGYRSPGAEPSPFARWI